MFLPIGDEPNLRGTPLVNWGLIALNVGVFVAFCLPLTLQPVDQSDPMLLEYLRVMAAEAHVPARVLVREVTAYDLFTFEHGFRPATPAALNLLTSMFLHAGFMHLAGNMLFLWIFGRNVELHFGRLGYLLIYLLTGAAATLFFALFRLDSAVPLIGASGAISGVLGCYFVWFPRNRVKILMLFIWFVDVLHVPARWVLGFYLIVENFLPFLLGSSGAGVAYGAHIGGFLGGAAFALLVGRWRAPALASTHATQTPFVRGRAWRAATRPSGLPALREALRDGRWEAALREYTLLGADDRDSLDDAEVLALADWLTEQTRYEGALNLLQRFVAGRPRSPMLAHAHLRAGLIQLRGLRRPTAAYQHLLSVLDLDPPERVAQAAREALVEVKAKGGPG